MRGSIKRTRDGRWTVRYRTPDGRQPRRTFTRRQDAERFLRDTISSIERGEQAATRDTISDLIPLLRETKAGMVKPRSESALEQRLALVEAELGSVRLSDLSYDVVQDWVNTLKGRYAPSTVRGYYSTLNMILTEGRRRRKVPEFERPSLPARRPSKLTIPTREEVDRLASLIDPRLCAAVILAGYCGLRSGEVLALEPRSVNPAEGWLLVHQAVNKESGKVEATKTDHERRVYMPAHAATVVAEHLAEYPGEYVFAARTDQLRAAWLHARNRASLNSVRFHDLRHAAASMMIAAGLSVKMVSQQLGHTDSAITLRVYSHLWPSSGEEAMRAYDAYLNHDASAS